MEIQNQDFPDDTLQYNMGCYHRRAIIILEANGQVCVDPWKGFSLFGHVKGQENVYL